MSRFEQRVTRLEQRMGTKQGPRLIYIMPNLEEDEREETPYLVKISSELWAEAFGGPFTSEEIRKLREEYAEDQVVGCRCLAGTISRAANRKRE